MCVLLGSSQDDAAHISSLEQGLSLHLGKGDVPCATPSAQDTETETVLPLSLRGPPSALFSVSLALFQSPHDAVEAVLRPTLPGRAARVAAMPPTVVLRLKHHPSKRILHAHRVPPGDYQLVLRDEWRSAILRTAPSGPSASSPSKGITVPEQVCPFLGLELNVRQVRSLSVASADGRLRADTPSLAALEA